MRSAGIATTVTLCVGLMAGVVADAAAQDVVPRPPAEPRAQACPAGQVARGDLGISGLECNCSYYIGEGGERVWLFRSEPVILGVREGGVADGKLREGDAINAIDGLLITTGEAGRRYANVEPGDEVTLTVGRGERLALIRIEAGTQCERVVEAPDAWHVLVEPPEVVVAPEPVVAVHVAPVVVVAPEPVVGVEVEPGVVVAPEPAVVVDVEPIVLVAPHVNILMRPVFPAGWFGFGISCNCSVYREESGEPPVWQFKEPPEVFSDRRRIAHRRRGWATLRRRCGRPDGDVQVPPRCHRRRGHPHRERAGRATFPVAPGGGVRRVVRADTGAAGPAAADDGAAALGSRGARVRRREDLERLMIDMVEVPELADVPAPDQLRFTGSVGDVDVEVWGGSSVITTVIEEGREIVIVTRDARITIKRAK